MMRIFNAVRVYCQLALVRLAVISYLRIYIIRYMPVRRIQS